jgi:hypothetical protein
LLHAAERVRPSFDLESRLSERGLRARGDQRCRDKSLGEPGQRRHPEKRATEDADRASATPFRSLGEVQRSGSFNPERPGQRPLRAAWRPPWPRPICLARSERALA